MFEQQPKKHAKITVVVLIVLFMVTQILGTFFFARQTKAITGAPDVVAALTTKWSTDSVLESLLAAGMGALVNASSYFMRKLAYDSAKYVASAASGQKPLVFQEGPGEYFKNVALDSAAGAIDQFGEGLFGTSLCRPPDLRVQAFIQIGLRRLYADPNAPGPAPRCTWKSFTESWEAGLDSGFGLGSQFQGADSLSQVFARTVSVDQSDFGVALALKSQVGRFVDEKKTGAGAERLEGQGFKSLTGLISGKTKTPAQLIKEESETLTAKQQGQLSAGQIAGIYGSGMLQVIPSALSVFLNTLVGTLLENMLTDGLFPDTPDETKTADAVGNPFAAILNVNREAAEKAFSYLITSVPTELSEFDVVNTYVSCPDNGENAGLNNCVMDDGLRQAIQRSRSGEPITIAQALQQGLLDPNRELISPIREADNTNKAKCWTEAYCYSNLQKLRRVRILPLGFEIAALKSDPDAPWRLGEVVAGFNDCEFNKNGVALASAKKPFCHLIDPNWVIKAPLAKCDAKVVGPQLVNTAGPQRREECVDIATCLATDNNGNCLPKAYGYCTKEENAWKIGGTSCPAQFATCNTYTNTKTGASDSYLARTIDFGECTQESVGCRAYSVMRGSDFSTPTSSSWLSSALYNEQATKNGIKSALYFNDTIVGDTCPADKVGCSAFYPVLENGEKADKPIYLKKAPNYYQCYDVDLNTLGIQWPEKDADFLELVKRPEQCKNFAAACTEDEVGCRAYKPLDGAIPELTGEIGANACLETCVGYDTFKQEESTFEGEKFPLYFIPTQADACNAQYEGCSEFTNLDTAAAGGETKEYYKSLRYCEKPADNNERVYYSWEGSPNQGYVLRVHRKLQVSAEAAAYVAQIAPDIDASISEFYGVGAPAYVDDTTSKLEEYYEKCNETNYTIYIDNPQDPLASDPDCRALYDENGEVYYRLLAQTVTVDESCHPIRATESNLAEDPELTTLTFNGAKVGNVGLCEYKGGLWGDDPNDTKGNTLVCRRCLNGGRYQNGACVYQTISRPGESESCPASANLCRAFTGNAGNNVQEVIFKTFEPIAISEEEGLSKAKEGWSNGEITADATHVSQHSLQIESQFVWYEFASSTIKEDGWYELSFWARGTPQSLAVDFLQDINGGNNYSWSMGSFTKDIATKKDIYVSIGQEWREYKLGPVQFVGNEDNTVVLRFVSVGQNKNQPYFIDNVLLTRQDKIHLIRDSWKLDNNGNDVPLECDATPNDGLPGAMLGCREYTDSATNDRVFATGFEKLCRPEAASCQGMFDTNNTVGTSDEALVHIYNARCVGQSGTTCQLTANGEVLADCEVGIGKEECYIAQKIVIDDINIIEQTNWVTNSTVIIPADPETPVYLTNRAEFGCASNPEDRYLGCSDMALETHVLPSEFQTSAYSFSETRLLNNPQKYDQTLCRADLLGCSEFRSGSNINYFKDPSLTGSTLCGYNDQPNADGQTGWFLKDIGVCKVDKTKLPAGQVGINSNFLCRTDNECGTYETCTAIGEQACYPDYLKAGGEFGIWSNESDEYKGYVGMCEPQHNGCTELVDRASNKSHYVVFDDILAKKSNQCEGKASLKEGCVLFDRIDNPNKLYNTKATYDKSLVQKNALVIPVTDEGDDANVLLKVVRDRECSEWLACRTSVTVRDAENKPIELCYEYKACRARGPDGECAEWVDLEEQAGQRLTEDVYVSRPTDWQADEYSGYSLFNRYPINNYTYVHFDANIEDDQLREYLAYQMPENVLQEAGLPICTAASKDGDKCGDGGGRCYRGSCMYPIDGGFSSGVDTPEDIRAELDYGICKSYPEKDSPYLPGYVLADAAAPVEKTGAGNLVRKEFLTRKQPYQNARVIQSGASSCEYQKVEYKDGSTIDYWPHNTLSTKIPKGICMQGEFQGNPCYADKDCGTAGLCSIIKQSSTFFGQRGFCLEFDRSRPFGKVNLNGTLQDTFACLTWLPIQTSASSVDLYNADVNAGYNPEVDGKVTVAGQTQIGGEVYCSVATDASLRSEPVYGSDEFKGPPINTTSIGAIYDTYFTGPSSYTGTGKTNAGNVGLNSQAKHFNEKYKDILAGMQSWAYKAIGPNAFLLRMEYGTNRDYSHVYPSAPPPSVPGDAGDCGGITILPTPEMYKSYKYLTDSSGVKHGVLSFGGFAPPTHYGKPSWGTFVHGPRYWGQEIAESFLIDLKEKRFQFTVPCPGYDFDIGSMASMSPGSSIHHGMWIGVKDVPDDGVYRAKYEADLNEYDLNKVYFVPTGYPAGASGMNPALLTQKFGIDINFLREQEGPFAYLQTADIVVSDQAYMPGGKETDKALVWAYKLERGKGEGLLTHYNYNDMVSKYFAGASYDVNFVTKSIADLSAMKRNEIHHRYVAVISYNTPTMDCNKMPLFLQTAGFGSCGTSPKLGTSANGGIQPPTAAQNPFDPSAAPCPDDGNKYNYLAIGMDFNEDGEFLGYISRFCHSQGHRGGINFAVVATLNNVCTEFTQVYDPSEILTGTSNKAWTQRVWEKSTYQHEDYAKKLSHAQPSTAPFGSLKIGSVDLTDSKKLRRYSFVDKNADGVPYSCSGKFPTITELIYGADDNDCYGLMQLTSSFDSGLVNEISKKDTGLEGQLALQRLFVMSFSKYTYASPSGDENNPYTYTKAGKEDKSGAGALVFSTPQAPKIFAINPYNCMIGAGRNCTAAEQNTFTIGKRNYTLVDYDGDGNPDEDKNQDGKIDPIIAKGFYLAIANFFAFADDDQMPIRRVMVDWGDDSQPTNAGKKGLYKNRKPFCEFEGEQPKRCKSGSGAFTGLTCTDDTECKTAFDDSYICADSQNLRFGDASRACTSGYFEFVHQYICSDVELAIDDIRKKVNELDQHIQEKLFAQGLTGEDLVCVFKPKVQVLDNWGWCNGSCLDSQGKKVDRCYEELTQCDYDANQNENADFPWTKYKGDIIVVPVK